MVTLACVRYKSGYLSGLVSLQDSDKCRVSHHVFAINYFDFFSWRFFLDPNRSGEKTSSVQFQVVFQTEFYLMLLALKYFGPSELCLIIDCVGPSELSTSEEEDQAVTASVQLPDQRTPAVSIIEGTLSLTRDIALHHQLDSPLFLSPPAFLQSSQQNSQGGSSPELLP